jgi:hypothetical protein
VWRTGELTLFFCSPKFADGVARTGELNRISRLQVMKWVQFADGFQFAGELANWRGKIDPPAN